MKILNIAAYRFTKLEALTQLQEACRSICEAQKLKGSIMLSPEGINLMLAGSEEGIKTFGAWMSSFSEFKDLTFKYSHSDFIPFKRLLIKIKEALVPGTVDPVNETASHLPPHILKQWYEEGRDFVIIDARNEYELVRGKFEKAIDLNLNEFKQFESAVNQLDPALKEKPVVFYCTGGIRCEKAAPLAKRVGFKEVYQLDGGILQYFKECGAAHYEGDCYVFDERIALDHQLEAIF